MNREEKNQKMDAFKRYHLMNKDAGPGLRRFMIEELEKAWKALEFYADERNYLNGVPGNIRDDGRAGALLRVEPDDGKRAREALNG